MELSVRSTSISWLCDHRPFWARQTRLSCSQPSILARKTEVANSIRCRALENDGELIQEKRALETNEDKPTSGSGSGSGSWILGQANFDTFSGWTSEGSQPTSISNATGWVKTAGVIVLAFGFALGARSIYSKRDVARAFTAPPPQTEVASGHHSKIKENSDVQGDVELNENVEVAETSGGASPEAEKNVNDDADVQLEKGSQNPNPQSIEIEVGNLEGGFATSFASKDEMDERISEEKPVDPEVRHASAIHENEVSLGVIESIDEVASLFTTDGGNVPDESDSAANVGGENPIPNESSLQDTEVTEVAEELNVEHTANAENKGHSQKIASQEDENQRADLFAAAGTIEIFLPTAITAPCIPAGTPSNSCGEIIVPAQVDNVQEQILAALQILKVIDADVKPGDICTRREYARWLMTASAVLTKSPAHKVIPAMFIENSSVLAYDDVTPQDPDFPAIQGLAEAGLLSSRLIDEEHVVKEKNFDVFSPDSPLTRQDLVTWKIALERKSAALDRDVTSTTVMALQDKFGFIDLEKVHKDAWPALLMDISAGEQSIIALTFGRTRRLQPLKPVTKGQAAVALATGEAWELVSEELARLEAESVAEAAVVAELALEAKAQKEAATVFENLVQEEKEKQQASASMLESTRAELEQIRDLYEGEKSGLLKERAALDAEKDLLTITRHEVEQQALDLCSAKMEVAFQLEQASKLRSEAEEERASISEIRKELEIEKNALILARSWAEDEARTAEEFSRKLEQWGNRLKDQDFNVNVGHEPDFIRLQQNTGTEAAVVSENGPSDESYGKIEEQNQSSTMDALIGKSREFGRVLMDAFVRLLKFLQELLHEIKVFITVLLKRAGGRFHEARIRCAEETTRTMEGLKQTVPSSVAGLTSSLKEGTLKAIDEWKEGAEKLSQKFKAP